MSASRRTFLGSSLAGGAVLNAAVASRPAWQDRIVVGVMGLSRGAQLAEAFAKTAGVEVAWLCDVDRRRLEAARLAFTEKTGGSVQGTTDVRRILDDPAVDALIVAAPNHWHAPAALLACAAGKHVYVEKPCSHNPREGELLVEAAAKYKRCVQMGNQRRSGDRIRQAMTLLHEGRIGRVYYSRSWYAANRGPIGVGTPAPVPPELDYELWQGPAPRQPFTSNRLHYHWHWVWHYGNGELGNNGIHSIDLSRWGLQVEYPTRVVSSGGRWVYEDDQQTADTHIVSFEFPGRKQIVWECLSCNRYGADGSGFGVTFHGERGTLKIHDWGYTILDDRNRTTASEDGTDGLAAHIDNFVAAIRAGDPGRLNSPIPEGHKSTLLCHLGNIAYRTGQALECDPANGHIRNSAAAMELWSRAYEPGWEPKV